MPYYDYYAKYRCKPPLVLVSLQSSQTIISPLSLRLRLTLINTVKNNPSVEDACREGKKIMQRDGKSWASSLPEDLRIGAGVMTVLAPWCVMSKHILLPEDLLFHHYHWTLVFM